MRNYRIHHVSGSCYVQTKKRGQWLYYIGRDHIRFDSVDEARQWIVENKFKGNLALALAHITVVNN